MAILEPSRDVEPHAQVVRDAPIDVAAEVVLVVVGPAVPVVPVLALAPEGHVVSDPIGTAPQRHVPDVLERQRLDHRAEPVGVGIQPRIAPLPGFLNLVRRVVRRPIAVQVDLVDHRHIRGGVRHLGQPGRLIDALVEARRQLRLGAAAALRRDQNHAVGRARAVDRRGGVLQHAHALDVVRTEALEPADAIRHAVDHDERAVVVQRMVATDPDGRAVVPRLAAPVDRHHAGEFARDRVGQIHGGHALQLLALDGANGAGQGRLALLPVPDRHDGLQLHGARPQPDVHDRLFAVRHYGARLGGGVP